MTNLDRFDWSRIAAGANVVVVCHASYELERSCYVAETVPPSVSLAAALVVGTSSTLEADAKYKESWNRLLKSLSKDEMMQPVQILESRSELMSVLEKAKLALQPLSLLSDVVVVFDISVFPKDRLWVLIDLVGRLLPNARLALAYTEPEIYDTELSSTGWLSKGVVEVVPLPGFNGRQDPDKRSLLVLNTGHENERMSITINNREPQRLILLTQGKGQHSHLSGPTAKKIVEKLREDYGNIVNNESVFEVDSRDYLGVRDAIRKIYETESAEYNISVAFFGTKVQSVGALLACQENRRLEALYARPQVYHREGYSAGVKGAWMLLLPIEADRDTH